MKQKQNQNSLLDQFEKNYAEDDYASALRHICRLVELYPDDHWYWTRLSSVFYELKRYDDALQASEIAMGIDRKCPLVLWDYAGVLKMLDQASEAMKIYSSLLERGVESIACGQCGEGLRWARSLVNDCRLRLAMLLFDDGRRQEALKHLHAHLQNRRRGQYSCNSLQSVLKMLRDWEGKAYEAGSVL